MADEVTPFLEPHRKQGKDDRSCGEQDVPWQHGSAHAKPPTTAEGGRGKGQEGGTESSASGLGSAMGRGARSSHPGRSGRPRAAPATQGRRARSRAAAGRRGRTHRWPGGRGRRRT
jgi:hypothetical protein